MARCILFAGNATSDKIDFELNILMSLINLFICLMKEIILMGGDRERPSENYNKKL